MVEGNVAATCHLAKHVLICIGSSLSIDLYIQIPGLMVFIRNYTIPELLGTMTMN